MQRTVKVRHRKKPPVIQVFENPHPDEDLDHKVPNIILVRMVQGAVPG
ncbi:hypothetical protein LCGC14_2981210, partial [marine sediment metagenome]